MTTPIYLIGMMGAGKSTLGQTLARELGRSFVDLDERIEARAGFPIAEIFDRYGEAGFRDLESAALAELQTGGAPVVALGGGTTKRPANRDILSESGCVVYLKADPATLAKRLADHADRPLLRDTTDPEATLRTLLARREPDYNDLADIVIDNEADLAATLDRLIRTLEDQGWIPR